MTLTIESVWGRLAQVRSLSFVAHSGAAETTGWTGQGEGLVEVTQDSSDRMLFVESGSWCTPCGRYFNF